MTIARDFSAPGSADAASRSLTSVGVLGRDFDVPAIIRSERLEAQIRSFQRAGYRLETRSGLQAVVVKPLQGRPVRDAVVAVATLGVALVPKALGLRRTSHRVVITVDGAGAVRLA